LLHPKHTDKLTRYTKTQHKAIYDTDVDIPKSATLMKPNFKHF